MARKRRASDQPIGVGMTTKQMKRKKPINWEFLLDIDPLTENQKKLFDAYDDNKNLVAYGAAGTGKTFITLYNALKDVLDENSPYEKIYIVRSLVATREIGFLPGIMKINLHCIKSHIKTWLNICSKCLVMQTLKCSMAT